MSSNLFPTFEPYWNKLHQKLTVISGRFSRTSPYLKAAFGANIIGIVGLSYLLVRLTFPEFFYAEEEYSEKYGMFSGIYGLIYLFGLSIGIGSLAITAMSTKYQRLLAFVSVALGFNISLVVVWGIFFS